MVFSLFWFQSLFLPSFMPLRMGSALLSRFDLVFILLDTPNEDHDHLLSEHVIAIRAGKQRTVSGATVVRMNSQDSNTSVLEVVSDKPLSERLKVWMFLLLNHSFWFCLNVRVQYVTYCRAVVYRLWCPNLLYYSSRVYVNSVWNHLSYLDSELELQCLASLESLLDFCMYLNKLFNRKILFAILVIFFIMP